MIRHLLLAAASLVPVLMARPAVAEPIRYASGFDGSIFETMQVRFDGTLGTFEPGSTLSLGHFVTVDASPAQPFTSLDGKKFLIGLRTPDFDRVVPAGPTTTFYDTTSYSGIVLRGHLVGHVGGGVAPSLTAVFDQIDVGTTQPIPAAWTPPPTFPLPLADVKLPASINLIEPAHPSPDGIAYASGEVLLQITPEPATLAAWALVGSAALVVRRRRARTRRISG